ncbi:MAG: hypothetical protein JSW02_01045 [candidate division WOR-3 bacterium]|nr:MAG: hypothetical protein JSW02_01045 [candidate division WOR-3 bacterium]
MMKRLFAIAVLCMLCLSMCGAPEEAADVTPAEPETAEEIAFAPLSEMEIQKFLKTYPMVKEEVDKAGKKFETEGEATDVMSALGQMGKMNVEIAGLDAKLKAAGTSWEEFFASMAKVWMAVGASAMVEQKGELEKAKEEMNDPNIPEAQREMMKGMLEGLEEQFKVFDKVPQQNIDLVKKYWKDIENVMD